MESTAGVLAQFGADPGRVARTAAVLTAAGVGAATQFAEWLAGAADPAMALAGWERLLEITPDVSAIGKLTANELQALSTVIGGSQVLTNTLLAVGEGWGRLLRQCVGAPRRTAGDHEHALRAVLTASWEHFSEQLRQLRHREYLRIGLADLLGANAVDVTMAELSALADGLFAAAQRWAQRQLAEQYGDLPGTAERSADENFVVIGMGKLGGTELNFSSDVDVVYLCEEDVGTTTGGSRGTLEAREYVTRLAELITRTLHEVTAAGFAFRVDLRLRPDGINGPIVNSVRNALLYYESYGQTWERTALIQARPIAGAVALGEQFQREVRPFVYRRYLDYATVADMKEMKARVETQLGEKTGRGNVKLGRGGIREIEFLIQVLQLIHGGRDEQLRGRGSLPTLKRLVDGGYLPADEGEALAQAYRFLRNVEHKIQIVHQRQTHTVPSERREQETLARRLGYTGDDVVGQLWADLDRHGERVRRAFDKLFYEPAAETRRGADPAMVQVLRTLEDREATLGRLRELGFATPEASYENLLLLRDGPLAARARARRKKALFELAPTLLATLLRSADPDLALRNLATFISTIGARTSFLALLRENPATLRMLLELFGGSQYLANAFIQHPELLDTLVRADLVRVHRSAEDLDAELTTLLASAGDLEDALDVLRRFRNQEFLRIGINDLQRLLEPEAVSAQLTTLAEVCLRRACDLAARGVCARYGYAQLPVEVVVVAMGKLGGGELNYNSDLDLIFVYADDANAAPLSTHECCTKFAQRLITVLQAVTPEGIVYHIDTRLRPSGRSGPLVSSLDGFRRYHETSAAVWERQALIKARPVAGAAPLAENVAAIVSAFVYRAPLTTEEVGEIHRLRQRMERELARESRERINIKTGRGGLVDVEFLTQVLQLRYGMTHPSVRARDTLGALAALAAVGALPPDDYAQLADGYRFLRRVENALRLASDRPVEDLERARVDLRAVAKRMGFVGTADQVGEALWREYEVRRETIRACYERWFARALAGLPDVSSPH